MTDKTKFSDTQIKAEDTHISLEIIEEEKYRYMWEKMLKIEQIKKEDQQKNSLQLMVKKLN